MAFILDWLLLLAPLLIWPRATFELLSGLGPYGAWIGYLVGMLYFTVLDSRIGGGRTVGKRLLGIRVLTFGGERLTLRMAFARTAILIGSFMLADSGVALTLPVPVALLLGAVGGITSLVILYLFVVNRRGGQSLHDMAVGAVVATTWEAPPAAARPVRRGHRIAIRAFVAVTTVLALTNLWLAEDELSAIHRTVLAQPGVTSVESDVWSVRSVATTDFMTGETKTWTEGNTVRIVATMKHGPADEDTARRILNAVVAGHPEAAERTALAVTVRHGFDLGVFSSYDIHTTARPKP